MLAEQGVAAEVFSITSWSELARDGLRAEKATMAGEKTPKAFITHLLSKHQGPVIAATDYVRAVPESVRAYLPHSRRYITLGTDGFGRSDTRQELRSH
ncbi:MAG: transketolase-like TK C-terminal-containing protein, partial [Limnohabitans sp.]